MLQLTVRTPQGNTFNQYWKPGMIFPLDRKELKCIIRARKNNKPILVKRAILQAKQALKEQE